MGKEEDKAGPHSHNETPPLKDVDENGKTEHEAEEVVILTRGQKFKRHMRRFWYYYLGLLIFSIIFLPVFFLVVIPAVAQLVMNKSDLVLVHAVVSQPKDTSTILTIESKIDLGVAIPVRIEPVTLNLFDRTLGKDYPYAAANIAGQTISGNYSLGVEEQLTPIQNMTAWRKFVHEVVFMEESTLSVSGGTNGYLGVLKCPVKIDKDITSPGLNKFNGFSITNAALVKARPDGSNLIGDVTLPNPTVIVLDVGTLVLDVGTLVLDVKSGDLLIGNATLTDVRLVPGSNTFPLSGVLDLGTVIDNLGDVLSTQGPALKHGNLSLSAVTKSITFENNFVEYYTDVLSQLTLTTEVAIGALLKNTIQNMDLGSILNGVSNNSDAKALIDGAESTAKSEDSGSGGGGLANLADNLKRNIHIRDVLDQDHPDHGDAIIDSLVRTFDAS